jgi:hypothetical protein
MFGEGLARGALARERRYRRGLRHRLLGGDLILGGCALQLLELQLDLIEKPRRPLGTGSIELAGELLDLQLLVCDQSLVVGGLGSGNREFGLHAPGPGRFSDQRCLQRVDVIGEITARIHATMESQMLIVDP